MTDTTITIDADAIRKLTDAAKSLADALDAQRDTPPTFEVGKTYRTKGGGTATVLDPATPEKEGVRRSLKWSGDTILALHSGGVERWHAPDGVYAKSRGFFNLFFF